MRIGRRLSTLLLVLALVGAPAVVLRIFCVGSSCDAGEARAQATVPFCPLPERLRHEIAAGFREGRSPDVMAATAGLDTVSTQVRRGTRVPWPGTEDRDGVPGLPDTRVPIVFFGSGVRPRALPTGTALDAIAPTLESITGFRRAHPEVRTGEAVEEATIVGHDAPSLVVMIAWKGVGTPDLERSPTAWPFLRRAMRSGAGTLAGITGSVPLDPAATLTTIGTGGRPSSHGITGTSVRQDDGEVAVAWSAPGAGSVIATLADDLDHDSGGRARVAAIVADPADRGIVGNGWYLDAVDDDTTIRADDPARSATKAAAIVDSEDLGGDEVTDVLGVVLDGEVGRLDEATSAIVSSIRDLVPTTTFVVTATGSLAGGGRGEDALGIAADVDSTLGAPVVAQVAPDGLFLDRDVLVDRSLTAQQVADAMRGADAGGRPLFDDVYPSFAVAFSRYC